MTIDEEIQLQPATSGGDDIVPEGRYTLHLIRLEKAPPSSFNPDAGPRIKWVFNLYAEAVSTLEKGTLFEFNGGPYEFWRTTSRANSPRAFARHYSEALMGRKMSDQEVPKLGSLLGLKMSALISYDDDPNDSTRKLLKMTGLKHVPVTQASAPAPAPKPAPGQVSADPTSDEIDRALIVSKLMKLVTRLKKLDAEAGKAAEEAVATSDLEAAPLEAIHGLMSAVQAAVDKALDD